MKVRSLHTVVVLCATLAIIALLAGCGSGSAIVPAPAGNLWGYIHTDGAWAIKAQFEKAGYFSDGLAPVEVGGKWGYINQAGQMVIKPQFTAANHFHDGLARVATKPDVTKAGPAAGYGWIGKTGKFVIPPTWDKADDFFGGLAVVEKGSAFGYVDTKGKVVIPLEFQGAGGFSEGLAYAESGGKWGYIDDKGSWVITPRYGKATSGLLVETQLAAVDQGLLGVGQFHNGYAVVWGAGKNYKSGTCHFIDKTGKTVFGRNFQAAGWFSEGLAAVEVDGEWGFIDASGHMVVPPQYGIYYGLSFPGFSEGLVAVQNLVGDVTGQVGYIDKTGNWVIQPNYIIGGVFGDGITYVWTVSDMFSDTPDEIIDKSGHVVYRNAEHLSTTSTSGNIYEGD